MVSRLDSGLDVPGAELDIELEHDRGAAIHGNFSDLTLPQQYFA